MNRLQMYEMSQDDYDWYKVASLDAVRKSNLPRVVTGAINDKQVTISVIAKGALDTDSDEMIGVIFDDHFLTVHLDGDYYIEQPELQFITKVIGDQIWLGIKKDDN